LKPRLGNLVWRKSYWIWIQGSKKTPDLDDGGIQGEARCCPPPLILFRLGSSTYVYERPLWPSNLVGDKDGRNETLCSGKFVHLGSYGRRKWAPLGEHLPTGIFNPVSSPILNTRAGHLILSSLFDIRYSDTSMPVFDIDIPILF
jgi:hypothetical protein